MNAKEKHILEVARACFFEQGYKNTTIMDIAHQAQVSQVTIYKYFNSKQLLGDAVLVDIIDHSLVEMRNRYETNDLKFTGIIDLLIITKKNTINKMDKDFYRFFVERLSRKDSIIQKKYNEQVHLFNKMFIALGRREHLISPELSDDVIKLYVTILISYFQSAGDIDYEILNKVKENSDEFYQIILYGLIGKR